MDLVISSKNLKSPMASYSTISSLRLLPFGPANVRAAHTVADNIVIPSIFLVIPLVARKPIKYPKCSSCLVTLAVRLRFNGLTSKFR